jgi:glycosyltransferase involved in cell wall biosynthesis
MTKICIVTQYFPPEMGAPQARLSELSERLHDFGWQIQILTALPNYPTGKIFRGYVKWKTINEKVGRLETIRVPLIPSKKGFINRLLCYFSFVGSVMFYGPKLCRKPDIIFVESPPLFLGYAAKYLSRKWKCPYIFNVSDLWPECAVRMGIIKKGLFSYLAEKLEINIYKNASGITGQTTGIIESIRKKVPGANLKVITNGVDPVRFSKSVNKNVEDIIGSEPGPIFVYAGLFGWAQGLSQILEIAKKFPDDIPGRFVLIGDGPDKQRLIEQVKKEKIQRIKIVDAQPRNKIPEILAASDVAIITLALNIPEAVPSKIYEAMATSLPIVLIAECEGATRIRDAKCGFAVQPNDIDNAVKVCVTLATNEKIRTEYGAAGRFAAETIYNRNVIANDLNVFLKSIVEKHTP